MKIRTPKTISCNSDRQINVLNQAFRQIQTSFRARSALGLLAGAIGLTCTPLKPVLAQNAITSLNTTYDLLTPATAKTYSTTIASPSNTTNLPPSNSSTTLNFGSGTAHDLYINSFVANSKTYNFGGLVSNIFIRRNSTTANMRQLAFFANTGTYNNLNSSYAPTMESILLSRTINRGTDNTFANTGNGSGNNNNVERIDFVDLGGIVAPTNPINMTDIGFLVLDRGGNDNMTILPITGIDAAGNPTHYGPAVTQTNTSWGKPPITITNAAFMISLSYTVMRKDDVDADWRPSDKGTQPIGGIYFSLRDLGVLPGQTIYGYSIVANDVPVTTTVPATSPDTVNDGAIIFANYPTSTTESSGSGIDLMAGGGKYRASAFPTIVKVSGNVFHDKSGDKVQQSPGEESINGTTIGGVGKSLYAYLIDVNPDSVTSLIPNKVVGVVPVGSDGNYSFPAVITGNYIVQISSATTIASNSPASAMGFGKTSPSIVLPDNWVTTGENLNGITGSDVADGKYSITVGTIDVTNVNFGIEQLPTAIAVTVPTQANPGGTATVNIPPGSFNTSTDPDGTVTSYKITAFPTNVTSITIDGVIYTATAQTGTTAFPIGGVTVLAANLSTIKVDPNIDGAVTVQILFKAIDNAGKQSTNIATVNVPFTTVVLVPQLLLVKRITAINGININPNDNTSLNQFVDDTTSLKQVDDNNPNWPTGSLIGAINGGAVKTGNTIEYTIYMVSSGTAPANNVLVCDLVPTNSIFQADGYASGRGILFNLSGTSNLMTNVPDSDAAQYFSPSSNPNSTYPNVNCGGSNTNGAIVVNVGNLTNATANTTPNSFGFFRFRAIVK